MSRVMLPLDRMVARIPALWVKAFKTCCFEMVSEANCLLSA